MMFLAFLVIFHFISELILCRGSPAQGGVFASGQSLHINLAGVSPTGPFCTFGFISSLDPWCCKVLPHYNFMFLVTDYHNTWTSKYVILWSDT